VYRPEPTTVGGPMGEARATGVPAPPATVSTGADGPAHS